MIKDIERQKTVLLLLGPRFSTEVLGEWWRKPSGDLPLASLQMGG